MIKDVLNGMKTNQFCDLINNNDNNNEWLMTTTEIKQIEMSQSLVNVKLKTMYNEIIEVSMNLEKFIRTRLNENFHQKFNAKDVSGNFFNLNFIFVNFPI